MNRTSSHQEAELLAAAALEILDGEELSRVLAHVRECADCAPLLEEYRAVAARLALELPMESLERGRSARLRDRLLVRAQNDPAATDRKRVTLARRRWGGMDRWAGWAVAAGLVGVVLTHHGFHHPLAYGWIVAGLTILALVGSVIYAAIQRGRVSALEDRLAQLEREQRPGLADPARSSYQGFKEPHLK